MNCYLVTIEKHVSQNHSSASLYIAQHAITPVTESYHDLLTFTQPHKRRLWPDINTSGVFANIAKY